MVENLLELTGEGFIVLLITALLVLIPMALHHLQSEAKSPTPLPPTAPDTYREFMRSKAPALDNTRNLMFGVFGLAGETGEIIDTIKKHVYYEQPIDTTNLIEEMGDAYYYFEHILDTFGLTLEQVQQANIDKLNKRYPNGYSNKNAKARLDKK